MSLSNSSLEFRQYANGAWRAERGHVPAEMAVTLTVNGETWLEFMCTPEHLDALAVGFLYNEGLIESRMDIAQLRVCPANDNVDVWTSTGIEKPARWRISSGCAGGVSAPGDETKADAVAIPAPPRGMPEQIDEVSLEPVEVNELVRQLFRAQDLHRQSGGVHASALSDGRRLFMFSEDIGRHNTLDKLAGRVMLEKNIEPRHVILTTGRISSEMMQKAARMGTAVVISCTAPTYLAVQMAEAWGMTLIGYARHTRFTLYAHPERIKMD
jgi:FdhD protein